ncbi:MAG: alpha-ketoacid dehydrogenase subunit beta, partial [Syntrophales bacterium]|nr:alpha-ketoacid dehydrogenase subunit beta [Syntrophales bacterium]
QHSQALQALFAHVPGLKVVMPATPYDAKGLMLAAIADPNPVVFIDDRWLYNHQGPVPEAPYVVEIGKARKVREGKDLTIVATSWLVVEAQKACTILATEGITAELIDVRTIKPLDEELILASLAQTGRLLVADGGWRTCGFAAEVAALAAEKAFSYLKAPVRRLTLPDCPAPASAVLEKAYYRRAEDIVAAAKALVGT